MSTNVATILIVDDEIDLCESLQFIFDDGNYKTLIANDVETAFGIVTSEAVDIVVSDIRMPGESGVDLLKRIKDRNPHKPKVILITGYADISENEAKALGAEEVIRKPINLEELFDIVEEIRNRD